MESYAIKNLSFRYPEQAKRALDELSFSIGEGQFVMLCGPSGCGKTTLLRQLKPILTPHGQQDGEILFEGSPLHELDQRTQSSKIGFVRQAPDHQIVTDKVWHELAFGLESLGCDTPTIRLRVAEMASFFGIQNWFYQNVAELSGGQKQLLNLASIMVMQPSVLILDEPTGQLDPIAAAEFFATVSRLNRELGITVIISEQRLEEGLPICDRVLVLDEGRLICDGTPANVGSKLKTLRHSMFLAMPAPMRIYAGVKNHLPCPVTVKDGRIWLDAFAEQHTLVAAQDNDIATADPNGPPAVALDEVWFRYEKQAPDAVKGLSMRVFPGEFYAILGGNGTGKTTTLAIIAGTQRPYRGAVKINGRPLPNKDNRQLFNGMLGVLPQNPQALFVKDTVEGDLYEMLSEQKISQAEKKNRVRQVSGLCRLDELLTRHPYDLSGGEQQRAALAKVLLLQPKIILLDEPTKGMDGEFKRAFGEILRDLLGQGVTVIMASHDIEFCAQYAHRCALFFDGNIVASGTPRRLFSGNSFYTTAANRMARHQLPGAVTAEDVIAACGGDATPFAENPAATQDVPARSSHQESRTPVDSKTDPKTKKPPKRSVRWNILAASAFLAFLATAWFACLYLGKLVVGFLTGGDPTSGAVNRQTIWLYALMIIAIAAGFGVLWAWLRQKKTGVPLKSAPTKPNRRRVSQKTLAALGMILLAIPLTIWIGIYYLGDRKYYFISMLIILESMLPFIMAFEGRKPQARELLVIAVLSAIAVAGRAAFFMLPQCKPVLAIVIIAGVAFGGEAGFLVGAVTAFASNLFFGQGPWTPWQMFAFGIIGFLAGILFRKGILRRDTVALCVFGGLATLLIYGGIMNPASVLMFQSHPTKEMLYLAYLQGIPFDLIHAASTVIFLRLLANPLLEKLDRIKIKYGLQQ